MIFWLTWSNVRAKIEGMDCGGALDDAKVRCDKRVRFCESNLFMLAAHHFDVKEPAWPSKIAK